MALATFTFDGGSNGANLANPVAADTGSAYKLGQYSTNAIYTTAVRLGGSGASTYSSGSSSYLVVTDGSGTWLGDGDTTRWVDAYVYVPTGEVPGTTTHLLGGHYFTIAGLAITSDRRFAMTNAADSSIGVQTAANVVPLDAWFRVAVRYTTNGPQEARIVTSSGGSAGTADYVLTHDCGVGGYASIGLPADCYVDQITVQDGSSTGIPSAGATSHAADASVATTDTITATARLSRSGAASLTTTDTVTATAWVDRAATASLSTTDTITATAALSRSGDASVSSTLTITASADVTPAPGNVTADAALSTTDAVTATATITAVASASVSPTATITATAAVTHSASASLSTTATVTATGVLLGEIPTTPGFLRGVEVAQATIRPRGGSTAPTIAALLSIDTATMTARVSTSAAPSRYGVAVFAGGSTDPVTAGLIPAGAAYVWFADDGIHVQEAS